MAYVDYPHYFPSPGLMSRTTSNLAMTASNHVVATVIQAPKTGDITDIQFATRTVTTGCTVDANIETLDGSGNPSGTLVNAGATASIVIANADDNVYKSGTLSTAASVTAGDYIAIAIRVNTGTPNLNLGSHAPIQTTTLPYVDTYNGTTWTKSSTPLICMIKYSGDSDYTTVPGLAPGRTLSTHTFNSGSTPDERGNRIVAPFNMRVVGILIWYATTATCDFVLYDSSDNVLGTAVANGTYKSSNNVIAVQFDQDYIDLTQGETYRIVAKPGGTNTTTYTMPDTVFGAFGNLTSSDICYTSRTNGGAWSETTTEVACISFILAGETEASGGGATSYSFS